MKLLLSALTKFICGFLIVGVLLFLPAGGFNYINAWIFLGLLFLPMIILSVVVFVKSPELLEKRLNAKEKENTQKGVVAIAGVVLLVSYGLYGEVMRENIYLSRIVKVEENQKVIDSGMYGIIRHPMYGATIFLFLSIPIVLGSWWSLICFLPYVAVIVVRILNEEKVLEKNLEGYAEYMKKVKYRLLPFIW